jgi:CHAD domain-containing protein
LRPAICPRWPRDGDRRLIELELSLSPDDAARLPRLRRLAALKVGRARNQPIRIVWHDTPAADLLDQGRAIAEQRGQWRLEQIGPNGREWPLGAPSPVLAEASSAAGLAPVSPVALMPVAAFEGRAIALDLLRDGEPVSLRLLDGVMRGVTAERRAARLRMAGSVGSVTALALELAEELPVVIPSAALASETIAAARAGPPAARRLGAASLPPDLSVAAAFAHVTGHLADVMLHWGGLIASPRSPDEPRALEPVHQMRVAMRRLRSAMSQFPASAEAALVGEARRGLKALAGVLGPARDWDVFCSETGLAVGEAFTPEAQVARLLAVAERRRNEHYRTLCSFLDEPEYRRLMIRLAALSIAESWTAAADPEQAAVLERPLPDFAAGVLAKRLKRLLRAGEAIDHLEPTALHEIRLLGKRMRYTAELLSSLWPGKAPRRFVRRLTGLQESLGVLNDGAVAAQLMAELGGSGADRAFAVGVVRGFVAGRGAAHREEIARAWHRFRQTTPFWT